MSKLGVMIIGFGRAGKAREKLLREHDDAELVCVVSRSLVAEDTSVGVSVARSPDVHSALASDTNARINIAVISNPNLLHADVAEAALKAGKHVLVDYPLAPTEARATWSDANQLFLARELFALAKRHQLILHVEHIELLGDAQVQLRLLAKAKGRPQGGLIHFTGAYSGWIGDDSLAGSPALRAVARLHRLADAFGPFAGVRRAQLERFPSGYKLTAELLFESGGFTTLIEERGVENSRNTTWNIECENGVLENPPAAAPGGLFLADFNNLLGQIKQHHDSYVSEERILHILRMVNEIEEALQKT